MGLMGRKNAQDEGQQAVPTNPPPPPSAKQEESSGGGIVGWLRDSYNGVYKIVLEPSMPTRATVFLLVFGIAIGLLWGYSTVEFVGANPNRLNDAAQEQWVRMVAVSGDRESVYTPEVSLQLLAAVPDPVAKVDALLAREDLQPGDRAALQELRAEIPEGFTGAEAVTQPSLVRNLIGFLVPLIVAIIVWPILTLIYRLLIKDNITGPLIQRFTETEEDREKRQKAQEDIKRQQEATKARKEFEKRMQEQAATVGPPVMTQLSIFQSGLPYDDSFEIEPPTGEFLGQAGAAIAESVDPDPVAVELWLFDMFTQQNLKKIFVTQAGYDDPSIRSRLESDVDDPTNDIKVAQPGGQLIIESDALRLRGEFSELEINENGRFANFRMEVAAWQLNDSGAGASAPPIPSAPSGGLPEYDNIQFDLPPAPAEGSRSGLPDYDDIQFDPPPQMPSAPSGGLPDYDDIQFDPPPQMPLGNSEPTQPNPAFNLPGRASQGGRLTPPPLSFGDDDEDEDGDPFGGTGDFQPSPPR